MNNDYNPYSIVKDKFEIFLNKLDEIYRGENSNDVLLFTYGKSTIHIQDVVKFASSIRHIAGGRKFRAYGHNLFKGNTRLGRFHTITTNEQINVVYSGYENGEGQLRFKIHWQDGLTIDSGVDELESKFFKKMVKSALEKSLDQ